MRRPRRQDNGRFTLTTTNLRPEDIDFVDGIPVVAPAVAIAQVTADGMEASLVEQAITTAANRGMINRVREARLRVALDDRHRRTP
jgi:hypothetical protein